MSAFPRVRAPGTWLALSQLDAAEMEVFDAHQSKALNAEEGGTWAPTSRIILGGDGLEMRATLAIGNGGGSPGVLDITDGSLGGVSSGGAWAAALGSATSFAGTTHFSNAGTDADGGAGHHVLSGGVVYVDDGASVKVRSGGTLQIVGLFIASSGSEVRLYDETKQLSGEFTLSDGVPMTLHGDVTIKSDGTLTTEASSTATFGGTHNLTGTLQTSGASAEIIVKANGSFTSEALATVSHAGDVSVGGTLDVSGTLTVSGEFVQTGTLTKSGSTAYTCERIGDAADADGTYGATKDLWLIPALASNRTYTLKSTSPTPPEGVRVRFVGPRTGMGAVVTFQREDTSTIAILSDGTGPWAEFVFHSGSWRYAGAGVLPP